MRRAVRLLKRRLEHVAVVFTGETPGSATRLLLAYLRLLAQRWRHRSGGTRAGAVPLLGFTIAYDDIDLLIFQFEEIFIRGVYEAALPSRAVVADVGANIGVSVLYHRWRHPTCHIIALEPNPDAFALLRRNVEDNGLAELELHPHAAGATSAQIELHIPRGEDVYGVTDNSLRASTERPPAGVASVTITVPCVRLSDVLPARVDLLKLDVEGAESQIVEELIASGRMSAVERVVLEHTVGDSMAELTAIARRLEAAGFHVRLPAQRTGPHDVLVRAWRVTSDDQRPVTYRGTDQARDLDEVEGEAERQGR